MGRAALNAPNPSRSSRVPACPASVPRLRPFSPNDIPAIAAVVRESLRENYPATIYVDIHKWWREGFLVAEEDSRIVGFVAGVSNAPQNARILMLAVQEPYRRRGIGSLLMDAFLRQCAMRAMRTVELEVRVSNVNAVQFYQRYGFQIAGLVPKFYTDGEDGYKMMRHL